MIHQEAVLDATGDAYTPGAAAGVCNTVGTLVATGRSATIALRFQ